MLNNCPVLGANADKFYPNVTTIDTAAAVVIVNIVAAHVSQRRGHE